MTIRAIYVAVALLAMVWVPSSKAQEPIRLELAIALDGSSSMSDDDFAFQVRGTARALVHPDFIGALQSNHGCIRILVFSWSSKIENIALISDWAKVCNINDATTISKQVLTAIDNRGYEGTTSIHTAVAYAMVRFSPPRDGLRQIIDISGDGPEDDLEALAVVRSDAIERGVVINGLPILRGIADLDVHFRNDVIGGWGSFVEIAERSIDFAEAMLRKLVLEVS